MEYELEHKPAYTLLKIRLRPGESLTVESGGYMLHKGDVEIKTSTGGVFRGLRRTLLGGEALFLNTMTAKGDVEVWLSPSLPGDIKVVKLQNTELYIQDSSYLAHYGDIDIDVGWKGLRGLIAEGELFWLKAKGSGFVFINSYGAMDELNLLPGDKLTIDNMHFVALDGTVDWRVRKFGGWKSFLLSGEGFVIDVKGPGRVWVQSRNLPVLAKILSKFIPHKR
jgi:uncharacterized protein (TIGR00266 family)